MQKVHDQERQVVQHVDARQLVVEFNAIEQDRLITREEYVPEVQVPVALADPARRPAGVEEIAVPVQRLQRCIMEASARRLRDDISGC
jgi:hypothetical protein